MSDTTAKTNGDELAVKAAVEHHVASYQRVVSERDELQKQNDKKDQLLVVAKIEIEQLRSERAVEQSRSASYQNERDDAVIRAATLLEALGHIKDVIKRHAPGDAN